MRFCFWNRHTSKYRKIYVFQISYSKLSIIDVKTWTSVAHLIFKKSNLCTWPENHVFIILQSKPALDATWLVELTSNKLNKLNPLMYILWYFLVFYEKYCELFENISRLGFMSRLPLYPVYLLLTSVLRPRYYAKKSEACKHENKWESIILYLQHHNTTK